LRYLSGNSWIQFFGLCSEIAWIGLLAVQDLKFFIGLLADAQGVGISSVASPIHP
jgi:hypothetical protein